MTEEEIVFDFLDKHQIAYECYHHPAAATIAEAMQYWKNDGSVHCKNLFFRNHKGNRHYMVCFPSNMELPIHDLERKLHQGKLSFASPERMMKYLALKPGSVSPFGLINDTENHVHLFLDKSLQTASLLSFHPNDCRATVVIARDEFDKYLRVIGNTYEYIDFMAMGE